MKKAISLLLMVCMLFSCASPVFAAEENTLSPQTDGYEYWDTGSIDYIGLVRLSDYIEGPLLDGSLYEGYISKEISETVSHSISGSYTSKSAIESILDTELGLSIEIGVAFTASSTGGAYVPLGECVCLMYREVLY